MKRWKERTGKLGGSQRIYLRVGEPKLLIFFPSLDAPYVSPT
jgi:hypothetical protein